MASQVEAPEASPHEADAATPHEVDVASPHEVDVATLQPADVECPQEADVECPQEADVECPRLADVECPRLADVEGPRLADVECPRLADVESPQEADEVAEHELLPEKLSTLNKNIKSVKGRVKERVGFWRIFACSFILGIVASGYKIPFYLAPECSESKNNRSALINSIFVTSEVKNLLAKGCVVESEERPKVVNPLSVSTNAKGKNRLILDLRNVNKYLFKFPVKYEGLNVLKHYVMKHGYLAKFDLHAGYHHIDIFSPHTDYLGFSWELNGTKKYFKFSVLPFGLSSACNIFSKFLRPLVKRWRGLGIKVIMYLDDGILVSDNREELKRHVLLIRKDLYLSGLVVNEEKSSWEPLNTLEWLGITISLDTFVFSAPISKVEGIIDHLGNLLIRKRVSARMLASLVGKITSLHPALGDKAYLLTKGLQISIANAPRWDSKFLLNELCVSEMTYWLNFFRSKTAEQPIEPPSIVSDPIVLYTDASAVGGGGYLDGDWSKVFHFFWDEYEQAQSSTYRELKAFINIVRELEPSLIRNKCILWRTDNLNITKIIDKGSMKLDLQLLARVLYFFREDHNVKIVASWISRSFNIRADRISKFKDTDNWAVSNAVFSYIEAIWGKFTCDLFADNLNTKCKKFFSKYVCPGTSGANAFKFNWRGGNNWAAPPVSLIGECLRHMKACNANGALVVPKWEASYFWPLICKNENIFEPFVKNYVEFNDPDIFFEIRKGEKMQSLWANMMVLKVDFRA